MSEANLKPKSQLAEEFMIDFTKSKDKLANEIALLAPEVGSAINDKLNNISKDIQQLSKQLHDAIIFLPSYSVKMRQNEIRELERALKEKEDSLAPKKKFGFKSKMAAAPVANSKTSSEAPVPEKATTTATTKVDNYFTIENTSKGIVRHGESELNGNDVLVKNCDGVTIILEGSPSTLRLSNLKNCKLLTGPVRTSIFIENVQDSMLYLCCQQLRTHSSERLDIYLRVGSRAIIEDCKEIRFGPYKWSHPKSDELHKKAEISADLERFDAVDDFNWLSSIPSPNWCVIPPEGYAPFPSEQT